MLQFECTDVIENPGDPMATVRFRLLLNGEPTHQFTTFSLQPDFCKVGDRFMLTAHDFRDPQPTKSIYFEMVESNN